MQHASELLERTHDLLGDALQEVERIFEEELSTDSPYVRDIIAHTRRFRGKRLRPVLCLLSAQAAGGIRREHLILSAVIEMIHTATLVHDDVLDHADVRRHVATVNVRWNNETSVLYGDFLFTHAFHLAAGTGEAQACRIIGRATNRVCEGELAQIRNRGNYDLTEQEYLNIIDGKTAELCALACAVGARYAEAEQETIERMETFGRQLGLAFQITDDVLDLIGIESTAGKTLGTDLLQRKLTLPIIRLLKQADAGDRAKLIGLLEAGTDAACLSVIQKARSAGTIDEALETARELAGQAERQLDSLPDSPARQILKQLPWMSIDRDC
jgi:octaprenyl-diphosphate synthase